MATFEELMKKDYGEDFENKFIKVKNRVLSAYKSEKTLIARADSIVDTVLALKLDIDSLSAAFAYPFVLQNNEIIEDFAEFAEVYKILKSLLSVEEFSNKYTDPAGLKEMLLAITKDIRVVIIKSAQMLVLARENVKKTTDKKAQELFMAIDDIYAPFAARLGLSPHFGNVFSSDVFYHAVPDITQKRAAMGILAVEMECAALYTVAAHTGRRALGILTISDHLLTGESTTAEERQTSFTDMMRLALETAIRL